MAPQYRTEELRAIGQIQNSPSKLSKTEKREQFHRKKVKDRSLFFKKHICL